MQDEYCGLQPNDLQSYHHFMNVHLFDHLSDIDRAHIHIPDGSLTSADDILKYISFHAYPFGKSQRQRCCTGLPSF